MPADLTWDASVYEAIVRKTDPLAYWTLRTNLSTNPDPNELGVNRTALYARMDLLTKEARREREKQLKTFRGRMRLRWRRVRYWKHRNWYRDYMRELGHHRQNVERLAAAYRPTEKDQ